jgi:hypothetical protein
MAVNAISREAAAVLLGMNTGPDRAPCRRDLADGVRKILGATGGISRVAVLAWVVEMCRALGYVVVDVHNELESVIGQMILAGDIASLISGGAEALVFKPGRTVEVAPGIAAALGATDLQLGGRERAPDAVIRLVAADANAVRIADELGPPSYRAALATMGLPNSPLVTLRDFAGLIFHELVRNGTEVAPEDAEIFGTLPGDGSWAYGKVDTEGACRPAAFRVLGDGTVVALTLPDIDALSWLAMSGTEVTGPRFAWRDRNVAVPRQLSVVFAIAGRREGPSSWLLPEGADAAIGDWMGAYVSEEDAWPESDPAQRAVISAPLSTRLVVEAGPGSGKTWVACRRTARLVEEGVSPASIVVISFTRAAVSELRRRVASFLPDPARSADLAVWTLDSLAWRLRSGFSGAEDNVPTDGYEANVRETVDMLTKARGGLAEFVQNIAHLVVDEAQDLVGARRELVAAFVTMLSPTCGITVFMDTAQAIYGWQEKAILPGNIKSYLLAQGFIEMRLHADHRTKTPHLRTMFAKCRTTLLDTSADPQLTYNRVRETVEHYADGILPHMRATPEHGSTLMLFRSRAETLSVASELWSVSAEFGLRLSGRRTAATPWIAAALSEVVSPTLSRPAFDDRWDEMWPPPIGVDRETAWTALRRAAPTGTAAVNMDQLRSRLSAVVLPPGLSIPEPGGRGLVLSTIHVAKGREADHVRLMMPKVPAAEGTDWGEEARILFVGATRARKSLRLGSTRSRLSDPNRIGRLWQNANFRTGPNARVEIGVEGDVDETAQVSAASWADPANATAAQARLRLLVGRQARLSAERVVGGDRYALSEEDGDMIVIGFLCSKVLRDLWAVGRSVHGEGALPPRRIRGLNLIGIRTAAAPGPVKGALEPYGSSGLWLVPIVAGVVPVFFSVRENGIA